MAPATNIAQYTKRPYPFVVQVTHDGYYFVTFPDLPGCMTGADRLEDLPAMVREVVEIWIETELEEGADIPSPTTYNPDTDFSGRFNLRLPKSLHRELSQNAERDGVSLNQYVVALLAGRQAQAQVSEARPKASRVAEPRATYATTRPRRKAASKTKPTTRRPR